MKLYQALAEILAIPSTEPLAHSSRDNNVRRHVRKSIPQSAPGKSTFLSFDDSHPERLVFSYIHPPTGRHHTVKVEASLLTGLTIRVTGNGCEKEKIAELFRAALEQEV